MISKVEDGAYLHRVGQPCSIGKTLEQKVTRKHCQAHEATSEYVGNIQVYNCKRSN